MNTEEVRKPHPSTRPNFLFESYFFLVVCFLCVGLLFLVPLLNYLQENFISQYRQDLLFTFSLLAPLILFMGIRWTTGRILPGRAFLYSLGTGIALSTLYTQLVSIFPILPKYRYPHFHPVWLMLAWPVVCLGLYFVLDRWSQWAKKGRALRRMERRRPGSMELQGVIPSPAQTATLERPERMRPVKHPVENGPQTLSGRILLYLYSMGIAFLICFALVWVADRLGRGTDTRTRYTAYLLFLVSPGILLGIMHVVRAKMSARGLAISCLISMGVLYFLPAHFQSVFFLSLPAAAFLLGYCITLREPDRRFKLGLKAGQDSKPLDYNLQHRRRVETQIERKFRSKRENSGWYHHPFY